MLFIELEPKQNSGFHDNQVAKSLNIFLSKTERYMATKFDM